MVSLQPSSEPAICFACVLSTLPQGSSISPQLRAAADSRSRQNVSASVFVEPIDNHIQESKTCSNAQLHMWTTHVHYTYAQCVCMTHASCIKPTTVQTHFAQLLYIRITCTVLTPQKGSTIFCSRCSKVKAVVERILKHTLCLFDFAVQEL